MIYLKVIAQYIQLTHLTKTYLLQFLLDNLKDKKFHITTSFCNMDAAAEI